MRYLGVFETFEEGLDSSPSDRRLLESQQDESFPTSYCRWVPLHPSDSERLEDILTQSQNGKAGRCCEPISCLKLLTVICMHSRSYFRGCLHRCLLITAMLLEHAGDAVRSANWVDMQAQADTMSNWREES